MKATKGADHPDVAQILAYRGNIGTALGSYSDSQVLLQESLRLSKKVYLERNGFQQHLCVCEGLVLIANCVAMSGVSSKHDRHDLQVSQVIQHTLDKLLLTSTPNNAVAPLASATSVKSLTMHVSSMVKAEDYKLRVEINERVNSLYDIIKCATTNIAATAAAATVSNGTTDDEDLLSSSSCIDLYMQALSVQRDVLGDQHATVLSTQHLIAERLKYMGIYDRSKAIHQYIYDSRRRLLGDEHVDTIRSMCSLADSLRVMGRLFASIEEGSKQGSRAKTGGPTASFVKLEGIVSIIA